MKVYRYGEQQTVCYNIVIEEDDGTIKVGFVGPSSIKEYIATPTISKTGHIRLLYGSGSSMPYKDENGNLNERFIEIK